MALHSMEVLYLKNRDLKNVIVQDARSHILGLHSLDNYTQKLLGDYLDVPRRS